MKLSILLLTSLLASTASAAPVIVDVPPFLITAEPGYVNVQKRDDGTHYHLSYNTHFVQLENNQTGETTLVVVDCNPSEPQHSATCIVLVADETDTTFVAIGGGCDPTGGCPFVVVNADGSTTTVTVVPYVDAEQPCVGVAIEGLGPHPSPLLCRFKSPDGACDRQDVLVDNARNGDTLALVQLRPCAQPVASITAPPQACALEVYAAGSVACARAGFGEPPGKKCLYAGVVVDGQGHNLPACAPV